MLVIVSPLLIGGAPDLPKVLIELGAILLALSWFFGGRRRQAGAPLAKLPLGDPALPAALFVGLALLQLVPLPPSVLGIVAPGWRALLERLLPGGGSGAGGSAPSPTSWHAVSLEPGQSLDSLLLLFAGLVVFWAAARAPEGRGGGLPRAVRVLAWVCFSTGLAALLGFVQRATWNGRILWVYEPIEWGGLAPEPDRVSGPFVNPDHFAAFLLLGCFAALALLATLRDVPASFGPRQRVPLRALAIGTLLLAGIGILASGSRGNFTALAIGLAAAAALAWRRHANRRREAGPSERARALRMAVLGVLTAGAGLAVFLVLAQESLLDMTERWLGLLFTPGARSSQEGRVAVWRSTLSMIASFPQGVGLGCWPILFPMFARPPNHELLWTHAHSDPIEAIAETGILGGLLIVWALAAWLRAARTPDWKAPREVPLFSRTILALGLGAFLLHASVDFPLRTPACAIAFAALAGASLRRRDQGTVPGERRDWARDDPSKLDPRRSTRTFAALAAVLLGLVSTALVLSQVAPSLAPMRLGWRRADGALAEAWAALPRPPAAASSFSPAVLDAAASRFRGAIRLSPASHLAHHGLALTTRDPDEAARELGISLVLDPTSSLYHDQMAMMRLGRGRQEEALHHIEEAVYYKPLLQAHDYLAGGAAAGLGPALAGAAERGLDRAYRTSPTPEVAGSQLARFHELRGEHSRQGRVLLEMGRRAGGDRVLLLAAVRAFQRANDMAGGTEAERAFRESFGGDGVAAEVGIALDAYLPLGKLDEAGEVLDAAQARFGKGDEIEMARGRLALARRDWDAASEAFRRVAERQPAEAEPQFLLGEALRQKADWAGALRAFEKAAALGFADATLWTHLGEAHEARREYDEAARAYKTGLKMKPGDPWMLECVERVEALGHGGTAEPEADDAKTGPGDPAGGT